MEIKRVFEGVFRVDGKVATRSMVPGTRSYSEELVRDKGDEYRLWNPYRSKLAAAILNGLKGFAFERGSRVLYIGAATGTTASHLSDIVGENGAVYCIELSERNMRELIRVCEARQNMLPILGDARQVALYADDIEECDIMYQDASAREQAELLKVNSRFLKKGGTAYFIIKSQSVDVSMEPGRVFERELKVLEKDFDVVETVPLEPFDRLHMFCVLKKR